MNIINQFAVCEVIVIDFRVYMFAVFGIALLLFLLPFIKSFYLKFVGLKSVHGKKVRPYVFRKYTPYNPEEFLKALPTFNSLEFQVKVFDIYKIVQTAWTNFDYETIRKNVTDELYNMYKVQLDTLKKQQRISITKDFALKYFDIVGMEIKKEMVSLTVFMKVECYDYVVNSKGKVIRGSAKRKIINNCRMTFIKGIGKEDNECPNCGAPLEQVHSTVCSYCNSVIINDNHDWVLSEELITSQRYRQSKRF